MSHLRVLSVLLVQTFSKYLVRANCKVPFQTKPPLGWTVCFLNADIPSIAISTQKTVPLRPQQLFLFYFKVTNVCNVLASSVNWCQHWFEYFPNPPLNILSMVENVLAHHDRELLRHLVDCGTTSQVTTAAGDTCQYQLEHTIIEEDGSRPEHEMASIITVAKIQNGTNWFLVNKWKR